MRTLSRWKIFLILMFSFGGAFYALPNFCPAPLLDALPSWIPKTQVTLGLDLQGGGHLLLEVDQKALLAERHAQLLDHVRQSLRKARVGYLKLSSTARGVVFTIRKTEDIPRISPLIRTLDPHLHCTVTSNLASLTLDAEAQKRTLEGAVTKSIETIRQRIDETGTKEPLIQAQGEGRILLQLPGVTDPERLKGLIGKTAKLSFQMVEKALPAETPPAQIPLVPGTQRLFDVAPKGSQPQTLYLVSQDVLVTGDTLIDAQPTFDENNQPQVFFSFNTQGARRFATATQQNIGRPFAIILDNQVISAPTIRTAILNGSGVIQGRFTVQEAQDLALLMRSGALPAPLKILEEKTVGPGLGADSIAAGISATLAAILVVTVFMLLSYSFFGIFANLALVFNLALLVSALSFLGATLTLPGIAGIALTLGMAVDANVLVNERICEELRQGRKMLSAIDAGYRKAMGTIMDSNLTTLIGAALLYYFGTGPVRGFAITLALGILISLFTAVSLSRVFVALWIKYFRPTRLPI